MELSLDDMMGQMNEAMADPKAFGAGKTDFEKDKRFYSISKKKDGSGSVLIRFLPSLNTEKNRMQTFITQQVHAPEIYKEEKKRFIKEVCPKTTGGRDAKCPICDYAWNGYNELKEAGQKESKEAKAFLKFAAKDKFITNILIIEDTENPENNGKVFLYEFGGQLQELIKKQMQPSEEEQKEKKMNPFNAWDLVGGKDFRLKLTPGSQTSNGFPSWADSFFSTDPRNVVTTPEQMKALIETTICLDEFISPDIIQSEDKLQNRLDYVTFKNPSKKDDTPKASKEAELGSTPAMMTPGVPSQDAPKPDLSAGLGDIPEWMNGSTQTPPFDPAPVLPVATPVAASGGVLSPEEFAKQFGF